jgi:hypothetical protein
MPCEYCTLFLFMFILILQLPKLKHSEIWVLEQPWKMVNKIWFQMLGNVNRCTKSSFKPTLGCNAGNPTRNLTAAVFPPLGVAPLTEHTRSGQGTVFLLSTVLIVCHKYFNLKWLNSYSFKESTYLLTKAFIQVRSLIFLKVSEKATALMDEPPLQKASRKTIKHAVCQEEVHVT